MKKELRQNISFENHLGCFGRFNIEDRICRKFCILSLRCAIEHDYSSRMEILEELLASDGVYERIQ